LQHLSSYAYYETAVVNCFKVAFFHFAYYIVYSSKLATVSALRLGLLTASKARIKKMEQIKLQSVTMDLISSITITSNVFNDCPRVPFL
jgi:hypothetical protein